MDEQIHSDDCSYPSNICNKRMNTDGYLEGHKLFSEEGYQRRFQSISNGECHYSCDMCHKSFRWKGDVTIHQFVDELGIVVIYVMCVTNHSE